jgi:hypothetical protein
VVASDRTSRIVLPAAYRTGSRLPQQAQRVPERWGHATDSNAEKTLCGMQVRGLFRFDAMLFEHLGHHLRCRACDEAAGHPHSPGPDSGVRLRSGRHRPEPLVADRAVDTAETGDPQTESALGLAEPLTD